MKLATIAAPQWATKFQKGEYHMVIAPWGLQVPGLAQYYAASVRPPSTIVMIDNGSWEGMPSTPQELMRLATAIRADEIILPDVLGHAKETLEASWECLRLLYEVPLESSHLYPKGVMFVPQGNSKAQWLKCRDAWLEVWTKSPYPRDLYLTLGVISPRQKNDTTPYMRRTEVLGDTVCCGFPVHMLGVPDIAEFASEELPMAHALGVRGVDTSVPFTLGVAGILLAPSAPKIPMESWKVYARLSVKQTALIYLNIYIMLEWLSKGEASDFISIETVRLAASKMSSDRRIYENPGFALRTCRVSPGKYAIRYDSHEKVRVMGVRPLDEHCHHGPSEDMVEVPYSSV